MKKQEVAFYKLDEIYSEKNEQLKRELLALRIQLITALESDRVSRKIVLENKDKSVLEIQELIEYAYLKNTSVLYFPNDLCCFYPRIKEQRARSIKTCDISGSIILPDSFYYSYRPMIDNIKSGRTYVLRKDIIAEVGYYDFFPQTLYEFEDLVMKLGSSYECEENGYNYYDLSKTLGEYLPLLELRKRR